MENQWLQGMLRPATNYRKGSEPNIYEKTLPIGKDTEDSLYFSNFKISIRPANIQFPEPMLRIQLANGKASVFQRCTINQLETLQNWLNDRIEEIKPIMKDQNDKAIGLQAMAHAQEQLAESMQGQNSNSNFLQQLQLLQSLGEPNDLLKNLQSAFADLTSNNINSQIKENQPVSEE